MAMMKAMIAMVRVSMMLLTRLRVRPAPGPNASWRATAEGTLAPRLEDVYPRRRLRARGNCSDRRRGPQRTAAEAASAGCAKGSPSSVAARERP